MRKLLWLFIMMAATKYGYQDYVYRTSVGGYLVAIEKKRAISACAREAGAEKEVASYISFENSDNITVSIGNPALDVSMWDVNNPAWSARYQRPHIVILARTEPFEISCAYDLVDRTASIDKVG